MSSFDILAKEYIDTADKLQSYVDKLKAQRKELTQTQLVTNTKRIKTYEDMIYDLQHNASTMAEYYEKKRQEDTNGFKYAKRTHKLP